jgi:hypothetical protein
MSLDFGGVLRRAWQITWNNKILWLFGIFSTIMSGGNGRGANSGTRFNLNNPRQVLPPQFHDLDQTVVLLIVLGIIAVIIIVAIVLFILGVIGRGGLIGGIRTAETQGKVTFGEAFAIGRAKFWTVLGIGLVVWVVSLILAGASLISFLTICLAPLACIGFLLLILLNLYARLAQIAAVHDNVGIGEALPRALRFIQANLGQVILLGLILVIIQYVISFVLVLPLAAIALPIILSVAGYANDAPLVGGAGIAVAGLCVVVYIPVLIVLGGIVETWVMSCWTLAYRQLTGQAPVSAAPAPTPMPA